MHEEKDAVVVAIYPLYDDDETYVAYDTAYWNRWIGDERIKNEMIAYYEELQEEKRRVKARAKKIKNNRMNAKARREGAVIGNEAGVPSMDTDSSRSGGRAPVPVAVMECRREAWNRARDKGAGGRGD